MSREVHTSTLLVIEDVQWTDEATLDLLSFSELTKSQHVNLSVTIAVTDKGEL
jgi:hypothetical protein